MIKKNFLLTLCSVLMLLGLCPGVSAQTTETIDGKEYTLVGTVEEFRAAWKAHKNIKLTSDINLHGKTFENECTLRDPNNSSVTVYNEEDFNCEVRGEKDSYNAATENPYYTLQGINGRLGGDISNLNMHHIVIAGSTYPLFHETKNCTFNELIFEKANVKHFAGLLTEKDEEGTFSHILFLGCRMYHKSGSAGLICGNKSGGRIDSCFVAGTCTLYAQEGTVGSLVGSVENVTVSNTTSAATVIGYGDRCGGIVGSASGGEIKECHFYGMVKQTEFDAEKFQSVFTNEFTIGYAGLKVGLTTLSLATAYGSARAMYSAWCLAASDIVSYTAAVGHLYSGIVNDGIMMGVEIGVTSLNSGASYVALAGEIFACGLAVETAWYVYSAYSIISTCYDLISKLSGPDETGGIAGHCEDKTAIKCCSNYGMIYSLDAYSGGIVGYAKGDVTISDCLNHGAAHGGEQTGGIAGYMAGGSIKTCFNIGTVSCTKIATAGRILGDTDGKTELSYNCYSDLESDLDDVSKTENLRVSQLDLVSGRAAAFLNGKEEGDSCWHQTVGSDHWPNIMKKHDKAKEENIDETLSTDVEVSDRTSLLTAMVNPYSDIIIAKDIDCGQYPAFNLCSSYMPFCGTIKGNGHHISNISYTQTGKTYNFWGLEEIWSKTEDVGIFSCAQNATFSDITFDDIELDGTTNMNNMSFFVAKSENCSYQNIHIAGNSHIGNEEGSGPVAYNVGGIVGYSKNDKFNGCSTGTSCILSTAKSTSGCLGGLVGKSEGSVMTECWNTARISCGGTNVGGLIGEAVNTTVSDCFNNAYVGGRTNVGGLIGKMTNSKAEYCSQIGHVDGYTDSGTMYSSYSVGLFSGCAYEGSKLDNCLGFGKIFAEILMEDEYNGPFVGQSDISDPCTNATYYFVKSSLNDGDKTWSNLDKIYDASTIQSAQACEDSILSGSFTEHLNAIVFRKVWRQDIDNNIFITHYPVPISQAGEVFRNYMCNGVLSYSNKYRNSTPESHETQPDKFGLCTVCGNIGTPQENITLDGTADLCTLAYANNKGQDFSSSSFQLTADADMDGLSCVPIGTDAHPFSASLFDGGFHHIKNMRVETKDYAGLFGRVQRAIIKNIVLDSTCVVRSLEQSAAGIVGCVKVAENDKGYVELEYCGNEATVYAPFNAAGLVGGAYGNFDILTTIKNCYNTGSIHGTKESAALVGWGDKILTVFNCYNAGTVQGYDDGHSILRYYYTDATTNIHDIYQPEGLPGDDKIESLAQPSIRFTDGDIANTLSAYQEHWGQNLGTDAYPRFADWIYHERDMSGTWGVALLPYDAESNESVQYYDIAECDENTKVGDIYLVPVEKLTHGKPVFFKKLDAKATKIKITPADKLYIDNDTSKIYTLSYPGGWNVTGKYVAQDNRTNIFYLDEDKMWYADGSITIPAYSAYLNRSDGTGGDSSKRYSIFVWKDDDSTKVGEITADGRMIFFDQQTYNLSGQYVGKPRRGQINIVGGKKIMIR